MWWTVYYSYDGPYRSPAGNARHADSPDLAVGSAARPRNRRGHPRFIGRCPAGGARFSLSGSGKAAEARADSRRLENDGEQTAGAILPAHREGEEGPGRGGVALEPHGGRDCPGHAAEGGFMSFLHWIFRRRREE